MNELDETQVAVRDVFYTLTLAVDGNVDLQTINTCAAITVNLLRAGGISDLTIRNTLVTPRKTFKEIKHG